MRSLILVLLLLCTSPVFAAYDGQDLYQQNCAVCHGDKAQGKIGPRLKGDSSKWSSHLFQRAVLNGIDDGGKQLKSPMPHWSNSSLKEDSGKPPTAAEIDAIQKYIRTLY